MTLELRLLRYFLAVVDHGSVSRAAAEIRVAQPSLSRQLRGLEADLGVAVFERDRGRLRLSRAGELLVPMARDLVSRAEVAEARLRDVAAGRPSRLTIAAPETTVADVIAPFLAETGAGGADLTVREELPTAVFATLQRGEADLAISSGLPTAGLAVRPIVRAAIVAYVPAGHRLAERRRVRIEELVEEPLILLGPAHGTRRLFDQAVAAAGASYRAVVETNVPQIAQALAAAGRGVAIVSDDPRYGLRSVGIVAGGAPLRIPLYAAWDPTHYAADVIEPLVDALAAYCLRRYGPAVRP